MTIAQIYQQFEIPPNLQEHQLRVASLLQIIAENWQGPGIDKSTLLKVGLCHDLANILKFDFNNPSMLGPEAKRIELWRRVQNRVRLKYGSDIHQATINMAQAAGLKSEAVRIIGELEWDQTNLAIARQDWPVMLAIYADMRIGPQNILSITDRIDNLHHRRPMPDYSEIIKAAQKLETIIQSHVAIDLNQITEADLEARFSELRLTQI